MPEVEWNPGLSEAAYRSLLKLLFPQPRTAAASSSDGPTEGAEGGGGPSGTAPLRQQAS